MKKTPLRIAMWSGPRNISTALMRAWENRADTFVTDEPFYAHYLAHTRLLHPGVEEILQSQPTDWTQVVYDCVNSKKDNCTVHYQKHMTHHMLPHIELEWLAALSNVFLIREPKYVVASYAKSRADLNAADLGFEQQARLFKHVQNNLEQNPLVISSVDLLNDPKGAMILLCEHCNIAFDENMLNWPAGKRDSDGVWAPYWYDSVEKSTGFAAAIDQKITLDKNQQRIADECQPHYDLMATHAASF